jgi:hypothetical protein
LYQRCVELAPDHMKVLYMLVTYLVELARSTADLDPALQLAVRAATSSNGTLNDLTRSRGHLAVLLAYQARHALQLAVAQTRASNPQPRDQHACADACLRFVSGRLLPLLAVLPDCALLRFLGGRLLRQHVGPEAALPWLHRAAWAALCQSPPSSLLEAVLRQMGRPASDATDPLPDAVQPFQSLAVRMLDLQPQVDTPPELGHDELVMVLEFADALRQLGRLQSVCAIFNSHASENL